MASASPVRNGRVLDGAPPAAVISNDGVLPADVLYEVLLRLPANALCRLRLVCRSWRSLTSDRHFAAAHSSRHPLLVGLLRYDGRHEIHALDLCGNIVKRMRLAEPTGFNLSTHRDLACVWSPRTLGQARVLNLATGTATVLPLPGIITDEPVAFCLSDAYVLSHVPSTNEYKALHIRRFRHNRRIMTACHVMALGDSMWRETPYPPVMVSLCPCHWALAVVDGVAYFLVDQILVDMGPDYVASFDMALEEWKPTTLQGPVSSLLSSTGDRLLSYVHRKYFQLARLSDCLVVVHENINNFSMDLWFLEDMDKALWTKRYSMSMLPGQVYPLLTSSNRRIVAWLHKARVLATYDLKTRTWTSFAKVKDYSVIMMYHGSLLYPGL